MIAICSCNTLYPAKHKSVTCLSFSNIKTSLSLQHWVTVGNFTLVRSHNLQKSWNLQLPLPTQDQDVMLLSLMGPLFGIHCHKRHQCCPRCCSKDSDVLIEFCKDRHSFWCLLDFQPEGWNKIKERQWGLTLKLWRKPNNRWCLCWLKHVTQIFSLLQLMFLLLSNLFMLGGNLAGKT